MTVAAIPDDLTQFILQYIHSIAHLEALLLFCAHPKDELDAHALAHALYITDAQAIVLLTQLLDHGFIAHGAATLAFHYQPASPELKEMVERLAVLYKQSLVPVTNLIHSKSKLKVQQFADAFKMRKD